MKMHSMIRMPIERMQRVARMPLLAFALLAGLPSQPFAQSFSAVTGLSGGAVSLIVGDRNIANPMVAVGITGVGLFTGAAGTAATGTAVTWAAQACDACAYARNAAWDDKGQLWVATSGQGLWRGTPGGSFSEVKLADSNIVQWVSRAADGTMWAVLGNGVVQIKADSSASVIGKNASQLGLDKLALPSSAGGVAYAASAGEVYSLDKDSVWAALKVPADPLVMAQLNGSLYVGTPKGVYQWSVSAWSALGPSNARITGLALASDGSLVVGTANAGVQYLAPNSKIWASTTTATGSFAEKRVLSLGTDASATVYAGLKGGLNVVQGIGTTIVARPGVGGLTALAAASAGLPAGDVRDIVTVGNDSYALVSGLGIFSRVGKSDKWTTVNDTLDDEPLQLSQSATAAYTVTASGSIYRFSAPNSSAGGWEKLGSIGLMPRAIAAVTVGGVESLWVAADGGVLLTRETPTSKWVSAGKGLERAGSVTRLLSLSTGALYAATTRGGVKRWDAASKAWVNVGSDGLPVVNVPGGQGQSPVNALIHDSGALYVGTNHGVFTIAANAASDASWVSVGSGLPEPTVKSLAVDAKGQLIAGTLNGAWIVSPTAAAKTTTTWTEYASTKGDGVAALVRVGNEVIVATTARPGKAGKVVVGG